MKNVTFYIDQAAIGIAPEDWTLKNSIELQRLYYIRGGRGRILRDGGEPTEFEAGRIYLFPYNFFQRFENDPDDPIDHIYFDFISTPPIIASEPIIYDVNADSALHDILSAFEKLLPKRQKTWMDYPPMKRFGQVPDADSGSVGEYRQTVYSLFTAMLTMLSSIREIPYSSDRLINAALEKIREDYKSQLSVAELAAGAGFEVNHFIRRFRKVMGVTPYAYLRSYRLMKARGLVGSGHTLVEVAELVGYENASSLSRALAELEKNNTERMHR